MYKIYLDGKLMYFTGSEELLLKSTKLSVELNRFGGFNFTIGKENPCYGSIKKKKSIVKIYDENRRLYRGRVLDAKRGFHNDYDITCEGEMGFLKDSVIRPYEFKGSVADYFSHLITEHNKQMDASRQFKIGKCTVTDPNDLIVRANANYPDTWKEIEEKLLKKLGGYLWTREEKDGIYIDYLKDFETINQQDIKFGENLLDLEELIKGAAIATTIIPLGCKLKDVEGNDTEDRLTIKNINNGIDYVEEPAAVEKYGRIFKTVVWDDVTLPENLLSKGKKELQNYINLLQSINLSAVDLHNLDADIRAFWIGNYTKIISEPHNLNELLLTRKIELDLLNPSSGKLSLGDERKTFIDKTVDKGQDFKGQIEYVESSFNEKVNASKQFYISNTEPEDKNKLWLDTSEEPAVIKQYNQEFNKWQIVNDQSSATELLYKNIYSEIDKASDSIMSKVSEQTYSKGETDILIGNMNTQFTQDKNSFEFKFQEFRKDLGDLVAGTDAKFTELEKYIRFEDGAIVIGIKGNPIILKMKNDRISFTENGAEVAYISNHRMFITELEVTTAFYIGNFAFVPRTNGNLSFKKVRG